MTRIFTGAAASGMGRGPLLPCSEQGILYHAAVHPWLTSPDRTGQVVASVGWARAVVDVPDRQAVLSYQVMKNGLGIPGAGSGVVSAVKSSIRNPLTGTL